MMLPFFSFAFPTPETVVAAGLSSQFALLLNRSGKKSRIAFGDDEGIDIHVYYFLIIFITVHMKFA